jgi:hypothetical protein
MLAWQYADDGVRGGIERDGLTDDVRVTAEPAAPHGIAKHNHRLAFRTTFLFGKGRPSSGCTPSMEKKLGETRAIGTCRLVRRSR